MPDVTSKRPLATLTKEECQTLFALAFGYTPPLERIIVDTIEYPTAIRADVCVLMLYPDGQILSMLKNSVHALPFNARKVITQLDAYNVAFGEEQSTEL